MQSNSGWWYPIIVLFQYKAVKWNIIQLDKVQRNVAMLVASLV